MPAFSMSSKIWDYKIGKKKKNSAIMVLIF